jgi:hypothetical protein
MGAEIRVGGVYSVSRAGGRFGVVKVVDHQPESGTVFVRVFSADFRTRPDDASFAGREPGRLDESLGVGIPALAVTERVFTFWGPVPLFTDGITEAELADLAESSPGSKAQDDLIYT